MTTFRVVSARAGGAVSMRPQSRDTATHATAMRRMHLMDSSSRKFQGIGLTPGGGLRRPSACRQARGEHTPLRVVNAGGAIIPLTCAPDRAREETIDGTRTVALGRRRAGRRHPVPQDLEP